MLILLPPSEAKNKITHGTPINLGELFGARELMAQRERSLEANKHIDSHNCAPAHQVYNGVLYKALDWESLSPSAQERGKKSIVIISALLGAVGISDSIPAYKAKIKSSDWKEPLTHLFQTLNHDVIIDCRSSTYSGIWTPPPAQSVSVRVFQIKGNKRSVITHMSKKYRGELTRHLLSAEAPKTPEQCFHSLAKTFEFSVTPATKSQPWYLDLLIQD